MGLVADNPPLAAGVGGAAVVGGGVLAAQAAQASFQRQQANLASALVGGSALGDTRTALGLAIMHAGAALGASQKESQGIAQQLASAGMRPEQIVENVRNVLLMSHGLGVGAQDVTPLVQALGTAGAMSPAQIANVLRELNDVSGATTGSLQKLTQALAAVSAVNPAAGTDAACVAALSRLVSPTSGINVGQLMAPAMGAFGSQAIGAAAILGMPLDQYVRAQRTPGGMTTIFGAAARFMRSMPHDVMGQEIGLEKLAQLGVLDTSGLKVNPLQQLASIMQNAPPDQAWAYYQQAVGATKPRPGRPRTLPGEAQPLIPPQTDWRAQLRIYFENMITDWLGGPTPRSPRGVVGHPMLPHVPSTAPAPGSGGAAGAGSSAGGKFGLHLMSPALAAQLHGVSMGAPAAGRASTDVTHTLRVEVVVKDQRGNQLAHKVDHTRIVAGARPTFRPPYDRPTRSPLDNPQPPGRWNEGWS